MNKFQAVITAIVLAVLFLSGTYLGYAYTDNVWQAKWDTAEKTAAQNQLNAVNDAVIAHNKRNEELEKANETLKVELANLVIAGAKLDDSNVSLQQSYADNVRRSSTCNKTAPTTSELAAEATNETVRSYVFGRISDRAVEYAKIADENRLRGLSCEKYYQTLVF